MQTPTAVSAKPVKKAERAIAQQLSSSAEPDQPSTEHAIDAPPKKQLVGSEELQPLLLKAVLLPTDEELVRFLDDSLWEVRKKDQRIIIDLMDRPQSEVRAAVKTYLAQLKQN